MDKIKPTPQPTVYVVQEVRGRNLTDAARYGDLVALLPPGEQVFLRPEDTINTLRRALRDFTSDDYLLAIGDPAAIAIASIVAVEASGGLFTMLKWDREHRKYYKIRLDMRKAKKGESSSDANQTEKEGGRQKSGGYKEPNQII